MKSISQKNVFYEMLECTSASKIGTLWLFMIQNNLKFTDYHSIGIQGRQHCISTVYNPVFVALTIIA